MSETNKIAISTRRWTFSASAQSNGKFQNTSNAEIIVRESSERPAVTVTDGHKYSSGESDAFTHTDGLWVRLIDVSGESNDANIFVTSDGVVAVDEEV